MSRIRSIKPEFWSSGQVMECSRDARLLFIGLWNFSDDAGRFPYSPKQVKALVLPGDDDISSSDVQNWLDELSTNGLICPYSVDGKEYFEITGWSHQKIDRPQPAKYPAPLVEDSTKEHRAVSTEGRGLDRIGSDNTLTARTSLADLRVEITKSYEAVGQAAPDTSYAGIWLAHGRDPEICLAVIRSILPKKPNVPLKYFDGPIADAHVPPKGEARKTGPPRSSIRNTMVAAAVELARSAQHERSGSIEILPPSAAAR